MSFLYFVGTCFTIAAIVTGVIMWVTWPIVWGKKGE